MGPCERSMARIRRALLSEGRSTVCFPVRGPFGGEPDLVCGRRHVAGIAPGLCLEWIEGFVLAAMTAWLRRLVEHGMQSDRSELSGWATTTRGNTRGSA
jgi:hypothetical protein